MLEIRFEGCELPAGEAVGCRAELVGVDNAREAVKQPNIVQGIVAASHPHSWLGGMWLRPAPTLFGKSAIGLTGAAGLLHSRLMPNPAAAAAIVGARLFLFRLPEPEVILPPGTDLIARIEHGRVDVAPREPPLGGETPEALVEQLSREPVEVMMPDQTAAADIINFAFQAPRPLLAESFRAAGWHEAEPLTVKSFSRTYAAFSAMNTYPSAPVSPLTYRGALPELVFQRSFNTLAKRHHIRLWRRQIEGEEIWMGAATHDVSIGYDWRRLSFTHRIDSRIDRERNVIENDLLEAGCVEGVGLVERPGHRATGNGSGGRMTDGSLAVVRLKPCTSRQPAASGPFHEKTGVARTVARRIVLETRQYVIRGNPYYCLYRVIQWGFVRRGVPVFEE